MLQSINAENKRLLLWLWGGLTVLNGIPFLPPLLAKFGASHLATGVYQVLGFLCHQRPDRSFFLFGEQLFYAKSEILSSIPYRNVFTMKFDQRFTCSDHYGCKFGVCARCTGMYAGMLVGSIVAPFYPISVNKKWLPYFFMVPLAVDGVLQTIAFMLAPEQGFYESTNPRRFLTGLLFGIGIGYIMVSAMTPAIAKNESAYYNKQ